MSRRSAAILTVLVWARPSRADCDCMWSAELGEPDITLVSGDPSAEAPTLGSGWLWVEQNGTPQGIYVDGRGAVFLEAP